MPSQSRKHRGYATQRIVAKYLQEHGFPHAQAIGAGEKGTDVRGTLGIDWEVYARRGIKITEKITQQLRRLPDGILPVGVMRPDGWGEARVGDWPVIVPLSYFVDLLRDAGYGDPPDHLNVEPGLPEPIIYSPTTGQLSKGSIHDAG